MRLQKTPYARRPASPPPDGGARRRLRHCRLRVEPLEDRTLPAIFYGYAPSLYTVDGGGPVLDHVHAELVYWGTGWWAYSDLMGAVTKAVDTMFAGPYTGPLAQYRSSIGTGKTVGSVLVTSSSPPGVFTQNDVTQMLSGQIDQGKLPNPQNDPELLYMVVPQPGSTNDSYFGEHSYAYCSKGLYSYGWVVNNGVLDPLTSHLSHEVAEAITDPHGNAVQVYPPDATYWNEISDDEAEGYAYRVSGVLLQSYFSQQNHRFLVPTGQKQDFYVSGGNLTVNGDQLASDDDMIVIDRSIAGGLVVTLNGETAQFEPGAISAVVVAAGAGANSIAVRQMIPGVAVNLTSTGTADVTVGDGGSLQGIQAALTVTAQAGSAALTLDDAADPLAHSATIDTVTVGGALYSRLTGLAPAAIQYRLGGSGGATIKTGTGGVTLGVPSNATTTSLTGSPTVGNTLNGPSAANTWKILAADTGTLASAAFGPVVSFTGYNSLVGGPATDLFVFASGQGVSGLINGGGGGNWLDYGAYEWGVSVNLATGKATGVGGSVSNVANVRGGKGDDALTAGSAGSILVGGEGHNSLVGGAGRDILIGGGAGSALSGGPADDIVIAGTTAFDGDAAALAAISAEWQRTDRSFPQRIADLQGAAGGWNGSNDLWWGKTVFDNDAVNPQTGGPGQDWFFTGGLASLADYQGGDWLAAPVDLLFAVGLDGQVYAQRLDAHGDPAWGYFLIGSGAVEAVSVGRDAAGNRELFAVGLNDRVYAHHFDANGNPVGGWQFTAEGAVQAIEVGRDAAGRPLVFARGLDGQVWEQKFDANGNSVGPYQLAAVGQVKAFRAGHDAAGRPQLFVIGLNDQVYTLHCDAEGNPVGSYTLTRPGAVQAIEVGSDAGDRPELFAIGSNGAVYGQKFDADGNSGSGYFLAAQGQVKAVRVGRDASGRPDVFVLGLDNQLYELSCDADGNPLGGYHLAAAGAVNAAAVSRDALGRPQVFATGLDDQVYALKFNALGSPTGPFFLTSPGKVLKAAAAP
jgi:hypothetical protein